MQPHRHDGFELIVCISGCTLLETDHNRMLITAGTVTAVRADIPHRVHVIAPPYRRWLIHVDPGHFSRSELPDLGTNALHYRLDTQEQMALFFSLERLLGHLRQPVAIHQTSAVYSQVGQVLQSMTDYQKRRNLAFCSENQDANEESIVAVAAVIDMIHRHSLRISVSELARAVHYSESHLRRIFRQTTTTSISDYIRTQRLEKAQRLLLRNRGNLSITAMAGFLGFGDIGHFSHYFKRHTGLSPLEYKEFGRQPFAPSIDA